MRVTIDLMKKSTQIIDLSNVINPRVGDDDLLLPLHIVYGDNQTDMRGKDVEFLSNDTNGNRIYVAGTCNTNTPGDNLYMGDLTFRFPAGTFKADGTYDPDKTMFRIVDKETQKVISSVNVKITVMKNSIEFDFDPDKSSYDSRAETMLQDFHDKGQAMLDEIKDLNNQAKSNVSGDTAATAKEAKRQADTNAGDISDLKGEVAGARGRFANMAGREDTQDIAINQKEDIANANANYAALKQKDAQQDAAIATKARQDFIVDYLSKMSLQPETFENESALKAKYPDGKPGIMVTVDTGHKWIYANGQWNDCGVYQSAGFTDDQNQTFNNALRGQAFIYDHSQVVPPYDDLNTLPANTTVSYMVGNGHTIKNTPDQRDDYTVITIGPRDRTKITGSVQVAVRFPDVVWTRMYWSDWGDWMRISSFGTKNANIYDDKTLVAPYDDLNTLPLGTSVTYSYGYDKVKNSPNIYGPFTVSTLAGGESITTASQIAVTDSGICYVRFGTSSWVRLAEYHKNINISSEEQAKSLGYDDLNNLPNNATVMYSIQSSLLKNSPISAKDSIEVNTIAHNDDSKYGRTQEAYNLTTGERYTRLLNGDVITDWEKVITSDMLDLSNLNDKANLPSLSMFGKFAVVGDSYASGVLAKDDGTTFAGGQDNLQWPVMMARKWGTTMLHLAKGGLSTRTWLTDDQGLTKLNSSDPQDIYYLCLGINDYYGLGEDYLGTAADMDSGADTFYGNYAKIIKAIQAKAPNAPIIMFGVANGDTVPAKFSNAQKEIASKFGIPFVSEREDPFFTSDYYNNFMSGGHPQATGYAAMALAMERLIQKTIVKNNDYFNKFGW